MPSKAYSRLLLLAAFLAVPATKIMRTGCLLLLFGYALLVSQVPAFATTYGLLYPTSTMYTTYQCGSASPVSQTVETGPLNTSISCTGGPTATGTMTVNYGTGQGSLIDYSGGGVLTAETYSADEGPGSAPQGLLINWGTLAPGTPVDLTVYATLSGTYSFTNDNLMSDDLIADIALTDTTPTEYSDHILFCTPYYVEYESPTGTCPGTVSTGGSGSASITIESGTLDTTAGSTGISLVLVQEQELNGQGTFDGDFLDPFVVSDILVTDPSTGAPVSGVTITGANGEYPVNVVSTVTPEPSSLLLLATGLSGLGLLGRRRRRVA